MNFGAYFFLPFRHCYCGPCFEGFEGTIFSVFSIKIDIKNELQLLISAWNWRTLKQNLAKEYELPSHTSNWGFVYHRIASWDLVYLGQNQDVREILRNLI